MEFTFPAFYDYPPSFTLQPVPASRQKQLALWQDLILRYCAHKKVRARGRPRVIGAWTRGR